jgi:hypothetical protein
MQRNTTPEQLGAGRDVAFKLYEYTVLIYMTLAAIEQMLRAWANHTGVPHLKPVLSATSFN